MCAIESARGLLAAHEIAHVLGVRHLSLGGVDLRRDLNTGDGDLPVLRTRSHLVVVSRAAGLAAPIDSVHARRDEHAGLRRQAEFARSLGFFGKSAIHPRQLAVLHDVFTPSRTRSRGRTRCCSRSRRRARRGAARRVRRSARCARRAADARTRRGPRPGYGVSRSRDAGAPLTRRDHAARQRPPSTCSRSIASADFSPTRSTHADLHGAVAAAWPHAGVGLAVLVL